MTQAASGPGYNRGLILGVVIAGAIVAFFNQTLLNVAIPHLMQDFQISTSTAQWVITIYMLVNGVLIPTTAFLMERFTTRQLFLTAMTLFSIGTLLCGVSPNFLSMLGGRMIQAAGAGIMMPLMTNVIFNMYPKEQRGSAMGFVGVAMVFAPAIGPTLSGWVVEHYPWRVLFFIILPIALIVLIAAVFLLKNVTETEKPKFDPWGVIFSTIGFGGILYGFSSAGGYGWASYHVIIPVLIGIISLVIFVRRQLSIEHAMLEFRIFRTPTYTIAVLISLLLNMTLFSGLILLPVFVQNILGLSPVQSGLLLLPGSILMGIMSPINGRLFDKYGARWLAIIGLSITIVTTFGLTRLSLGTTFWYLATIYTFRSFGLSMLMMPVMTAGLNSLPLRLNPHGTAMSNTLNAIGGAIGTALFVSIMTIRSENYISEIVRERQINPADQVQMGQATLQGMTMGTNDAFLVATCFAAAALILAFFLHDSPGPERQRARARGKVAQQQT
ncbi:DHA2 family efflux MFS transporter permease subunit [Brevibacillus panacihumi]|uniref:DHA2 family efflux MFS transporter permease subunit n=1 Tax=Brevibacillus panacihumi TaxID=497735 RepID=UPI003D1D0EEC